MNIKKVIEDANLEINNLRKLRNSLEISDAIFKEKMNKIQLKEGIKITAIVLIWIVTFSYIVIGLENISSDSINIGILCIITGFLTLSILLNNKIVKMVLKVTLIFIFTCVIRDKSLSKINISNTNNVENNIENLNDNCKTEVISEKKKYAMRGKEFFNNISKIIEKSIPNNSIFTEYSIRTRFQYIVVEITSSKNSENAKNEVEEVLKKMFDEFRKNDYVNSNIFWGADYECVNVYFYCNGDIFISTQFNLSKINDYDNFESFDWNKH